MKHHKTEPEFFGEYCLYTASQIGQSRSMIFISCCCDAVTKKSSIWGPNCLYCVLVCVCESFRPVRLLVPPRTVAHQAPLSMGFSRQEYWSGLPCPPPGDLPHPRIEPRSPALQADSLPYEPPGKPKNTGVGGLSLRQGVFPTQESNWGLLHCRPSESPHPYPVLKPCSISEHPLLPWGGVEVREGMGVRYHFVKLHWGWHQISVTAQLTF